MESHTRRGTWKGVSYLRVRIKDNALKENKIVKKIMKMLSASQHCVLNCKKVINNWIIDSDDGELLLEFSVVDNEVTFNTVSLKKKRKGTLTGIVNTLLREKMSVAFISVMTPEMYHFCDKNGFELYDKSFGFGSYRKKCK